MKCGGCGKRIERGFSVRIQSGMVTYCLDCKTRRQAELITRVKSMATKLELHIDSREWCELNCDHPHMDEDLVAEIWNAANIHEWGVVEHLFDIAARNRVVRNDTRVSAP